MNPRPVSFTPLPGSMLEICFSNGEIRLFNVGAYIRDIPALSRLKEPSYFKRAYIANNTVVWSDEEDICPDTLYLDSHPLQQKAA